MTYTYDDTHGERLGIIGLLKDLDGAKIRFKDLHEPKLARGYFRGFGAGESMNQPYAQASWHNTEVTA